MFIIFVLLIRFFFYLLLNLTETTFKQRFTVIIDVVFYMLARHARGIRVLIVYFKSNTTIMIWDVFF